MSLKTVYYFPQFLKAIRHHPEPRVGAYWLYNEYRRLYGLGNWIDKNMFMKAFGSWLNKQEIQFRRVTERFGGAPEQVYLGLTGFVKNEGDRDHFSEASNR